MSFDDEIVLRAERYFQGGGLFGKSGDRFSRYILRRTREQQRRRYFKKLKALGDILFR